MEDLSSVVLSSKIFNKNKLTKPVEYSSASKQLSIFSRGLVREEIASQVLLELAKIGAQKEEANPDIAAELDKVIKPYLVKFLKARI